MSPYLSPEASRVRVMSSATRFAELVKRSAISLDDVPSPMRELVSWVLYAPSSRQVDLWLTKLSVS